MYPRGGKGRTGVIEQYVYVHQNGYERRHKGRYMALTVASFSGIGERRTKKRKVRGSGVVRVFMSDRMFREESIEKKGLLGRGIREGWNCASQTLEGEQCWGRWCASGTAVPDSSWQWDSRTWSVSDWIVRDNETRWKHKSDRFQAIVMWRYVSLTIYLEEYSSIPCCTNYKEMWRSMKMSVETRDREI